MKKRTATKKKKFNPICLPMNSLFLNISNTDATSLSFLKRFEKLTSINATDTLISDLKDVQISESIIDIKLKGTPFSKNQFYRIMLLIGLSPQIQIIDDDDITKDERDLAEALQNTTLLYIYQGYLITNLDPLTLLLNNKKEPNTQPIIIPANQIVIGPHQTLSEVKARQTFAMIEDLSNEIQKTAFDMNLKTIQKNEVGNLLKQIKKVNTNNKKGAKKIQNPQSTETVTNEVPVQKTQTDDSEYYLSLLTKMNYVNTTSVKPIEPPKEVKPVEEETPTKSPKLTRTELKQLIREKRKQNSSLLDSPVQKSPQKIEIPAPQETNPVEKKKKKKTIKVIKVKHITKNEQAKPKQENTENESKTPLKRSASAMKPKESPKTYNDIQQIKKNVSTPENKSPKVNKKPRSASATPTRPTKGSPPTSKENLNSSKKTTTNKKTPVKTDNKTSNSINKSPKQKENSPKSKNEQTIKTEKSNSNSPKQNKTNENKDLITKEGSPIKLKKTVDESSNSTPIQKNKINKENIKEEPAIPNNSNEIESIKTNSIQSPLDNFPKENNFTPPHNSQKTSNSMISTPNLSAMSLWEKPATPIVSIMKTSKQTTPQEKKSVRFSFNKSVDNDQNMTNESINDEITSLTFLENNISNDELFTSPKQLKDKFSSLRKQNKNKQKEDSPVSPKNAKQNNVTNQTNKLEKSNKSNQKIDNNSNQNVDTKSNQKDDNNSNQNDVIVTINDDIISNQNKEEEDDISQAELEYEKWKQQQKEMQQQTVNDNLKDFSLDEVPDEDSSSTQIRKRYGSIYAAFSDESSSELPPEYSTAFHSFSKEMSFHKESDSENKNLNSDVLFNSPIHNQIDQTVGYSPDVKPEPNLLLLDNNEGTISENLLDSDLESSDAFMSSSSTESSGHRSHMKRDKLKAMREKNMKKKQEIERRKNAERMQSLVESFESLSEPEPHFNDSENQEIESNSKEQTNNDESEDSIAKIRNESRKRQQRLANGGSLFSSSFGLNSISESETINQESFHEGKEQNENDDSVIKDIELPVNKENSELNNSNNEVHQTNETKKELDQPPNQTIQTVNQEVEISNEIQINNQEESETITKEQEQISNQNNQTENEEIVTKEQEQLSNQNNQDENEEIVTKEIESISNQNNNQEEIDVNLKISKEDESPQDQNNQEVNTKQSSDLIQSPIDNPKINETGITTNKEEQIVENKTEVKPSKPKTTKKKIITKRKIVKGGQNKASKAQNKSEPKEEEIEPPKEEEETKMIYRFKLEAIPIENDNEETNDNTQKESANPIDPDSKPLNDKQSTESIKESNQPENKKRKILQITNTLDLDISKNAQNIPNSPPVQTNLSQKHRSPSLPVKSNKQSDSPNSGKGSPSKSHIPVPTRSHSPIPKPPTPPKPLLLKKSLIPTRNSKAKKLFDPSLLSNETKNLNQESNTTESKSNTVKKNTSFEEPKVRESQIKQNDELPEEDDQSYLDTPIAKKKKRKNSKGTVVYTSIVHKKSDDIDETKDNDDEFLNFEPLSSKELFKNNFAVDDNDIRQILDNHLPSSAEPIFALNSSREYFSENEINEPPSSSKPLNEVSDDDDSSIINYSISEAIKDFPHQNITQIKSDLDVRLTEYELHENSINKQNSLDTVLINFDKESKIPEVNGSYENEKKAKNKIAQEKKTDEINDNFSNEKNIDKVNDIPNKFVQEKKSSENVKHEKKNHKVKDTFDNEKKVNNKMVQETVNNFDVEKKHKTHKVNNTVINEKKTNNNFINEDNQTKTKNKTEPNDKLIPEDKESYNKSDFFLTEDDNSLPIIKDIENDEMESTPTIKNDGLFDSDNPNDLFLLQFSLINEEEDEIEQAKTPTPRKKTIKKRKHSKGKRSSVHSSGESSPKQSLSPRSRAKYDDEQLEKILQLKPKVPVQGGSGLSSPTNNKNPFSITPNNSSHDQLNLIDEEKDEKTFTISSENKHSDDLDDIFFKPDKVSSPDDDKTDLLLLNQENEIKLDLLSNDDSNFLTKNSKKNGKLDFPFPGKISINQDSLYENLLHMPSESAQIDEFLELEEIVKLDSNFVLSSSEIPKKAELIKQRENNSVPEESKVSPIKPLPIHDIKLYDEMLILPSESENGETVRKRRRNRKESNKNDEFDVPKRAFSFDEYDDLPTYLSENEDESGDENNEVNLPKPNIEKNSLFNPNFVFQSDSDSTSEFFKNQNKGKNGS